MGSGPTRKSNDTVIINRPKPKKGAGGGGGTGGGGGQQDMNLVCPPTIKVRLDTKNTLPVGARLTVEEGDIFFSGKKVGSFKESQVAMMATCLTEGFKYPGVVAKEGNNQYGIFSRV